MVWVVKNSQKNGVLMDLKEIISEKPRCTNPYRAWDTGEQRGFLLTLGKFFIFDKNNFFSYPPGIFF
jgi:hypothetical protein